VNGPQFAFIVCFVVMLLMFRTRTIDVTFGPSPEQSKRSLKGEVLLALLFAVFSAVTAMICTRLQH
jgi:hypothetical protein